MVIGALTPTEVDQAEQLRAAGVKIFPARTSAPAYIADLLGPFSGLEFIPSGGVEATNAAAFLAAGAVAVTAGTSIVAPRLVTNGNYDEITGRARVFVAACDKP